MPTYLFAFLNDSDIVEVEMITYEKLSRQKMFRWIKVMEKEIAV